MQMKICLLKELKMILLGAKISPMRMKRVRYQILLQLVSNLNTLLCSKNNKKFFLQASKNGQNVLISRSLVHSNKTFLQMLKQ